MQMQFPGLPGPVVNTSWIKPMMGAFSWDNACGPHGGLKYVATVPDMTRPSDQDISESSAGVAPPVCPTGQVAVRVARPGPQTSGKCSRYGHGDWGESSGLCYPPCREGYHGVGPVCWGTSCPPGFHDDGMGFCYKPKPYGRGVGRSCLHGFFKCDCHDDEDKYGLMCYPKCHSGYHNVGCCICSPNCPSNMVDMGVSCAKPSYGRGVGKMPKGAWKIFGEIAGMVLVTGLLVAATVVSGGAAGEAAVYTEGELVSAFEAGAAEAGTVEGDTTAALYQGYTEEEVDAVIEEAAANAVREDAGASYEEYIEETSMKNYFSLWQIDNTVAVPADVPEELESERVSVWATQRLPTIYEDNYAYRFSPWGTPWPDAGY